AGARKVEFWRPMYGPDPDVKLTPLALTAEQVRDYQLPRIPIKAEDRRKAGFEQRHGQGAVELDALEALHPGELERIIRRSVAPYRDTSLAGRLADAHADAEGAAERAWQEATSGYRLKLRTIRQEASAILGEYQERLRGFNAELQAGLAPLKKRLDAVRQDVQGVTDSLTVELPDRPEPGIEPPD